MDAMPLIACPECKKEISDIAKDCPFCGHPLRQSQTNKFLAFLVIAGLLLYGLYQFVIWMGPN